MTWIAIADHDGHRFSSRARARDRLTRGALIVETCVPTDDRPQPLVYFDAPSALPFHLSLQSIPGGGLTLVINQGGEPIHCTVSHSETGRSDLLRATCAWDADRRLGRLALERSDRDEVLLVPFAPPRAMRLDHAHALFTDTANRYLAPEVRFIALSDSMEPVGPMPTLCPDTPIATPRGYRAAGSLKRGDTVLAPNGDIIPVLHALSRTVPARGSFRPVRLRAPYFGLQADITVAPSQRLVITGSEVEYLFNREAVLVEVRHLVGGTAVLPAESGPLVTYTQLLLPGHEAVIAAGAIAETLYVGRLRRRKDRLGASILAGLDRQTLPEHGKPLYPVLGAFDSVVLAEQRAA